MLLPIQDLGDWIVILAYLTKAHLLGCVFFVFIDNEVGVLISCISLIPKPEKSNLNPLLLAQYVYTDRVVFFITKSREKNAGREKTRDLSKMQTPYLCGFPREIARQPWTLLKTYFFQCLSGFERWFFIPTVNFTGFGFLNADLARVWPWSVFWVILSVKNRSWQI